MATKRTFNFKLDDHVAILTSGENGHVVARMQSIDTQPQYQVRYSAADGPLTRAVAGFSIVSALRTFSASSAATSALIPRSRANTPSARANPPARRAAAPAASAARAMP